MPDRYIPLKTDGTLPALVVAAINTLIAAGIVSKAPLASPAFTGTPTGITKTHVGLGNVDNTADASKPVSTAQQTAINTAVSNALPVLPLLATVTAATALTKGSAQPVDATAAAIAMTALPALSTLSVGDTYGLEKYDATANLVSVAFASGDTTLRGLTSASLSMTGALTLRVVNAPSGGGKLWQVVDHVRGDATLTAWGDTRYGEVTSASNESTTTNAVGVNASVVPDAGLIFVPASTRPVWVHAHVTLAQTAAGTGSAQLSLLDYTNSVFLESEFTPLPNTVGRQFGMRVSTRLEASATGRIVAILVGNNADSGQTGTVNILNGATTPSRIWAETA